MKKYGLLGFPLGHSFSKKYFEGKFQREHIMAQFDNLELEKAEDVVSLIAKDPELMGFAVTIPHKETIIALLDEKDEAIVKIKAVNCVKVIRQDGAFKLKGYNTDVIGFEESFKMLLQSHHKNALILGTGGASKAVAFVLHKLNITYQIVSRHKSEGILDYADITPEVLKNTSIVINTTPLGMYPHTDTCPDLPYSEINASHYFYDLVYNPAETLFLAKAKEQGATVKAGMDMLELQAEANWVIWNEK